MGHIILFAAGIWFGVEQRSLLPPLIVLLLLALVVALFILRRSAIVSCVCCFALGFLWLEAQGHWRLAAGFPPELHRVKAVCEGQVLGLPELSGSRWRFGFQLDKCLVNHKWLPMSHRTRVAWYRPAYAQSPPQGGERWQFELKFKLPRGQLNLHGFDYETWLFQRNIQATAYISDAGSSVRVATSGWWSQARWREWMRERLQSVLPSGVYAGVIPALVLADRSDIAPALWQRFRDAGTGHLLAISGLHVGLVAAFGTLFGRLLWRLVGLKHGARATWMGLSGLLAAALYAGLAGFALPTVRALIMLSFAIGAMLSGRHRSLTDTLAAAFLVLLVVDPLSVLSAGFWLSFCSVAGIVMGLGARAHWSKWQKVLWINAAMGLVLAPLSHLLFAQLSWWCSPANLIVVPVFSFVVVPLSLLGSALAVLNLPGATALLHWAAEVIGYCDGWQAWLLALPTPELPMVGWAPLGLMLLSLGLLMPRMWRGSSVLILAALVLMTSPRKSSLSAGGFIVSTLDVGHGLAVLVETQHHMLVYDTGPAYGGGRSAGESVVLPALKGSGWVEPDAIMLSHDDSDHAGGLPALQRQFARVPLMRGSAGGCRAGDNWQWDGVYFELLHPALKMRGDNDNSCVLRVSSAAGSALLAGDVERAAEQQMLARGVALDSDLLIVPHHGSKTSSSAEWLAAVSPEVAVISVAKDSRWGMPHAPVVARLENTGARIVSTGDAGEVVARFDRTADSPKLQLAREQRRRFWHLP